LTTKIYKLQLKTHEEARESLCRLIAEYDSEGTPEDNVKFRNTVHAFSVLLTYFSFSKDMEIEARILKLETKAGMR